MKNKALPFRVALFISGLSFLFLSLPFISQGQDPTSAQGFKATNATELDWGAIGPNNYGGFISSVLFDSQDPDGLTLYAGSLLGGLYKSDNAGQTWNKTGLTQEALKVSCMVQDANGNIYVGTGQDIYINSFIGSGIYKSTDGANFVLIPSTAPNFVSENWWYIYDMEIEPATNTLYAATNTGLWYSTNGGNDWSIAMTAGGKELSGPSFNITVGSNGTLINDNGIDSAYIALNNDPQSFSLIDSLPNNVGRMQFAIAPGAPEIIYATLTTPGGALHSVWRSDDNGLDWRVIAPGGTSELPFFGNDPSEGVGNKHNVLEVFPDNPDRILIGGTEMWEGEKISETGYFQWKKKSAGSENNPVSPYYFAYIHPNHVDYVFRPNHNRQLMIATEGGVFFGFLDPDYFSFEPKNKNLYSVNFNAIGITGEKRKIIGGTHANGTLRIDGNGNPATARYGKPVWYSANGYPSNSAGGFCHIPVVDPEAAIYSQTGNAFRRSEDLGTNFSSSFFTSQVSNNIADQQYPPTILWESFNDTFSPDSVWFYAREDYSSGDKIYVKSNMRAYGFFATTPFALQPGDSVQVQDVVTNKFFVGGDDAVWMSREILDFAVEPEWFKISDKINVGFDGTSKCLGLSRDANYLWVGTEEGRLYRISNLSDANNYDKADIRSPFCIVATTEVPFIDPETGEQNEYPVSSISVSPSDPNLVIFTLEVYTDQNVVYRSNNALDQNPTFEVIHGNLPTTMGTACLIEMNDPNTGFLGTLHGLYMTENLNAASPEWFKPTDPIGSTIGNTPVSMLKQQLIAKPAITHTYWNGLDTVTETSPGTNNYGVIYAATWGRGAFSASEYQKPVGIEDPVSGLGSENTMLVYPNPVRDMANIQFNLKERSGAEIWIFDINGRAIKNIPVASPSPGENTQTFNVRDLPNGTYFLHLRGGNTQQVTKFIVIK